VPWEVFQSESTEKTVTVEVGERTGEVSAGSGGGTEKKGVRIPAGGVIEKRLLLLGGWGTTENREAGKCDK